MTAGPLLQRQKTPTVVYSPTQPLWPMRVTYGCAGIADCEQRHHHLVSVSLDNQILQLIALVDSCNVSNSWILVTTLWNLYCCVYCQFCCHCHNCNSHSSCQSCCHCYCYLMLVFLGVQQNARKIIQQRIYQTASLIYTSVLWLADPNDRDLNRPSYWWQEYLLFADEETTRTEDCISLHWPPSCVPR